MKPARAPGYLFWLRTVPCCVCNRLPSAGHHPRLPGNGGGVGLKPGDDTAVPLCFDHHTGDRGVHRGPEREFWERHGIDPRAVARRLWSRWMAA